MLQYGDVFSVFPQITEQRPAYEQNKGQTITDKSTKSKDFPYFPYFSTVFCLKPSTGEEIMVIFSFPVDTIPKLEKEDQQIIYF